MDIQSYTIHFDGKKIRQISLFITKKIKNHQYIQNAQNVRNKYIDIFVIIVIIPCKFILLSHNNLKRFR